MMDDNGPNYLIRDQDEGIRPLDLLQAWGPPVRPPLRVRLARLLYRIARWLDTQGDAMRGISVERHLCGTRRNP